MNSVALKVRDDFSSAQKPDDTYTQVMQDYYVFISTGKSVSTDSSIAYSAYGCEIQREIVESLLFAEAEYADISEVFSFPIESLHIYAELFFDISVFRTKLDKIAYLDSYPGKMGKELKLRAMNLGPEFVYFTYGNIVPKGATQRKLVEKMFMASAYKAMSLNYNGITTAISKAALEHAKFMVKAYEVLERFNADNSDEGEELVRILLTRTVVDNSSLPTVELEDIV